MHRIDSIQGYRAFLFVNIFLFHILGIIGIRESFISGFFMGSGRFGVTGFMLLTGVLTTYGRKKVLSHSLHDSIKGKIHSFLKKYYFWHIIFMVLALPFSIWALHLHQKTLERFLLELLSAITLTQTIIPIENLATSLNDVAWYLSTYIFLLPIIVVVIHVFNKESEKGNKGILLFMILTVYATYIVSAALVEMILTDDFFKCWLLYYFFIFRAFEILIGALLGRLLSKLNWKFGLAVFFVSSILYIAVQCCFEEIPSWLSYSLIYVPVNCLLIATCLNGTSFMRILWSNQMLTYLGNRSMYYYLCHVVLAKYLIRILSKIGFIRHLNNEFQNIIFVIVCFVSTIIVGEVMLKATIYYNHRLSGRISSDI